MTFTAPASGRYQIDVFLTVAPDYGTVELKLDGTELGASVDLYAPMVMSSGRIALGKAELRKGEHQLEVRVPTKSELSSNYYCGLDCLELKPVP